MDETRRLVDGLSGGDVETRRAAAEGLAHLGEEARPVAASLAAALDTDDEIVREWLVAALEGLGPPSADDVGQLTQLLQNPCSATGYWAATLLGRLGPSAAEAVPALAESLGSRAEASVRQRAAWALWKIGPVASGALPTLRQAADSDDPRLANLARRAIEQIGGRLS